MLLVGLKRAYPCSSNDQQGPHIRNPSRGQGLSRSNVFFQRFRADFSAVDVAVRISAATPSLVLEVGSTPPAGTTRGLEALDPDVDLNLRAGSGGLRHSPLNGKQRFRSPTVD